MGNREGKTVGVYVCHGHGLNQVRVFMSVISVKLSLSVYLVMVGKLQEALKFYHANIFMCCNAAVEA